MKNFFLTGLAALAVLATGCSSDVDDANIRNVDAETETSAIKIVLQSEYPTGRAEATDALADESAVKNYTALVFDYESGLLENVEQVTGSGTATIDGVSTAGGKRIVVIANANTIGTFPTFIPNVTNYSALATSSVFSLNDQQTDRTFLDANGLVMTGEAANPIFASTSSTITVPVMIRRIVAKVTLGSITIDSDPEGVLADFKLQNVSIQQAKSYSTFDTGNTPTTTGTLWGGITGSTSTSKSYLVNNITLPGGYTAGETVTYGNFFYVFPNPGPAASCTMLTLGCTYDYGDGVDKTVYFPVKVNYQTSSDVNTDGQFIMRNKKYTLHLTIKNLRLGTNDPDVPPTTASIAVTVTVADWEGDIVQNETL